MTGEKHSRDVEAWKARMASGEVLLVGVDIGKRKDEACVATKDKVLCRRLRFGATLDGIDYLERTVRKYLEQTGCREVLVAMEPTGVYWQTIRRMLSDRGWAVCCTDPARVKHNRKTLKGNGSKTDRKDAYCILDLLRQGKVFFALERDAELEGAHRFMRRYEACRKRTSEIRNQLRDALYLVFPELEMELKTVTIPTVLKFLSVHPTPASIAVLSREEFVVLWRGRHGRWGRKKFEHIYDLAKRSIGIPDEGVALEYEIRQLVSELEHSLEMERCWLSKAIELVRDRREYQIMRGIKGLGEKIAVGILAEAGLASHYQEGKQWVKQAGLDVRLCVSGDSVRKVPRISHKGNSSLRSWAYQAAVNLVRYKGPFQELYHKKQRSSPGKGSKKRALVAVSDKLLRVLFAMVRDNSRYNAKADEEIAKRYERKELKKAA
jgi:transposase